MAIFSGFSSRWSVIGALAVLCITGAVCGLLYSFVFFGLFGKTLLMGAIAGALITFLYGILEIKLLPVFAAKHALTSQYFLRVSSYAVLFLISLFLVSLLHAFFSSMISEYGLFSIFREDYLRLWPAYVTYSLLAALVFQSVWLFNKINNGKNIGTEENKQWPEVFTASVFVISIQSLNTVSQDRIIALLNSLSSAIAEEKSDIAEFYDSGKLKILFSKKPLSEKEIIGWEQKLYNILQSHISSNEKMLQLEIGYAFGEVHLQTCGMQSVFHGNSVSNAEANMKVIIPLSKGIASAAFALPFIF